MFEETLLARQLLRMDKTLKLHTDLGAEVMWKTPTRLGTRIRTISVDSATDDNVDLPLPSPGRRFSFTEMLAGPLSSRKTSLDESRYYSKSVTDSVDFKALMQRQKKILEEQ